MKNVFKYFTIMTLAVIFALFSSVEKVKADNTTETQLHEETSGSTVLGRITVDSTGKITIRYKRGYRDVLVYVKNQKCGSFDAKGECNSWLTEEFDSRYILYGGAKKEEIYKDDGFYTQVFQLGTIFELHDKVSIWAYADFFNNSENIDNMPQNSNAQNMYKRMNNFISNIEMSQQLPQHTRKYPWGTPTKIYYGSSEEELKDFSASAAISQKSIVISKDSMSEVVDDFNGRVNKNVIPILLTFLGIVSVVMIVYLGVRIVRTSDEPQERSEHIKHLKSVLIGVAVIFLILMMAEPVTNMVKGWME